MATMIPQHPAEFDSTSREDEIFEALNEGLPKEYIVFHSVGLLKVFDEDNGTGEVIERQTDFIVFHPQKGIMCIEAKAGRNIRYENGEWYYSNGELMEHHGPVNQIRTYVHALIKTLKNHQNPIVRQAITHCKVTRAIWFPSISNNRRDELELLDLDKQFILTREDRENGPKEHIDQIFDLRIGDYTTNLQQYEVDALVKAFSPKIVISYDAYNAQITEEGFNRLLKQQYNVLEFLQEQPTAVISGTAGTGKTMIAGEKAERHAQAGEKVLFLCYNKMLAEDLKGKHQNNNIDIYTIDGYVTRVCGEFHEEDRIGDYQRCLEILNNDDQQFVYKHVIIDEGQDICVNIYIERVLDLLKLLVELKGGTFYIFYDKLQLVQYARTAGDKPELPRLISNADCKLTLYRNCRNTIQIAKSATAPVMEKPPLMMDPPITGGEARICFLQKEDSLRDKVTNCIKRLTATGIRKKDIVIITLSQLSNSSLQLNGRNVVDDVNVVTFRTFKGLEARAAIIVDFDIHTFENYLGRKSYYIATSRAKEYLYVFAEISNNECRMIDNTVFGNEINNTIGLQRRLNLGRVSF